MLCELWNGAKFIHDKYSYLLTRRHTDQRIIDTAIRQWRTQVFVRALAKGGHFEHTLSQYR